MLNRLRHYSFQALNRRFFYGWIILPVAGLTMFGTGPSQSHVIGIFFEPISEELGLSRTSVAIAYGIATLFAAFLLPKVGSIIDRAGPARTLWILTILLSFACITFSFSSSWIYLLFGFGLLRFFGQGGLMLNCNNIVSHWFDKKRGFALGLMALGFPISMAVHPPLCQWLIETIGWRETWVWLGIGTLIILLPPILMLTYNKPEDLNLEPDGLLSKNRVGEPPEVNGLTLSAALRSSAFYIISASLFTLSMLVTSLHIENKGILMQHGLSAQNAVLMFTIAGITAAISMPIIGKMLDCVRAEWMLAGGLTVTAISLFFVTLVNSFQDAIIYALIFGLTNGITMNYVAFFWPRYFGRKQLGKIQGTGQMVVIVGASLGPLPLAVALDVTGHYDITLRGLTLAPLALAIVSLFLREPALLTRRS